MKRILLLLLTFISCGIYAQDLPNNPEPGKCYVRCTTPDTYVNEDVQIMIKPAYKVLKTYPAEYKTVTESVLVKEASKKLTVVPAKWGTETVSYVSKERSNILKIVPATFSQSSETIEIKPAYAQWELGTPAPDCESSNPDDCRYWCYKGYPAEYETFPKEVINVDASTVSTPVAEKQNSYTKKIIVEPAKVVEVEIPAEYDEVTKTVLVKDAYTVEETVPAEYQTITKEVLKDKGGLTTWKEVECKLVEYNALPINWNLASYTLTPEAKKIIDDNLIPVIKQNPGVKIELALHTDSRGSKQSNQILSERRAQAVANYLISKGFNSSLLVANGYGETKHKNRCADGVSCTEREHAVNRRTEFRLINN
ncbi:OmpA family protein [Galbibacter sp. PAP.153]|uniref:OmpA family protein n=1 Tax=Galbibacter sp. PAP.153 TaxID=3104623 RepID=UPI00300A7892